MNQALDPVLAEVPADRAPDGPMATPLLGDLGPRACDHRLQFTGTGSEYFRIWIVNTLLTLLTLGIYSAWAKRRKARWFARHTLLDGDPFDYHGDPRRILIGRVLALGLLFAYGHAFEWSKWAGLAMVGSLYLLGPFLFAGAQRFKLANTSWRGLRFGFHASGMTTYLSCLPLLMAWTFASVAAAMGLDKLIIGVVVAMLTLGFPLAHAWLKRFQHRHAFYGAQSFSFQLPLGQFYGLYFKAVLLGSLVGFLVGVVMAFTGPMLARFGWVKLWSMMAPFVTMGVAFVLVWPYYATRLQAMVWGNTRLGEHIDFQYDQRGWRLIGAILTHGLLVLLTCGLYWPFAAVKIAKLRIEGMRVQGDIPLPEVVMRAGHRQSGEAAGDGAIDAFGLDLGW